MKKLFVSMCLLVAGVVSAFAVDYTAKVYVNMGTTQVKVRESATFNDGYTNGYCNPDFNGTGVVVYNVIPEGERWTQWGCSNVEGLQLAFTPTATDVTFTFSNVTGTLYLVDANDASRTLITEGGSYNFTVAAGDVNNAVNNRFSLSKLAYIGREICHRDGKLQVTGMKNSNVVVKNMDDSATKIGTVAITDDYQEITLKGVIAAGQYKVEYNDGTAHTVIIDVQ